MKMGVFEGSTILAVMSVQRPRFFFGNTREGSICRFRYDLPENLVARLMEVAAAEPMLLDSRKFPNGQRQFVEILRTHAPIDGIWSGPAYRFPDRIEPPTNVVRLTPGNAGLLKGDFAEMMPELNDGQPYFAIIEDSEAVSICQSVRLSSRAHEAGVDTLKAYRQRGYATSAVAAWALSVRSLNLVPLYSTSWDNVASQGGRPPPRLGAVWCGLSRNVIWKRRIIRSSKKPACGYWAYRSSRNHIRVRARGKG